MHQDPVQSQIAKDVSENKIIMYIKGEKGMPQCGFSKAVMDVFDDLGVDYKTVDVLSNPDIREGVKRFTSWPTIPQVFIDGKFIGGCDIVREMFMKGELQTLVNSPKK